MKEKMRVRLFDDNTDDNVIEKYCDEVVIMFGGVDGWVEIDGNGVVDTNSYRIGLSKDTGINLRDILKKAMSKKMKEGEDEEAT